MRMCVLVTQTPTSRNALCRGGRMPAQNSRHRPFCATLGPNEGETRAMNDLEIRQRDGMPCGRDTARRCGGSRSQASCLRARHGLAPGRHRAAHRTNPFLALSALMLGFVAADFLSGFIHWMADTGARRSGRSSQALIASASTTSIKENHAPRLRGDPTGTTASSRCPFAVAPRSLPDGTAWFFVAAMTFSICLTIMGTNQFHKWAHMDAPPRYARMLQRAN